MTLKKHPLSEQVGQDWLKGLLRNEMVNIEFIKKDGSHRAMLCTLKSDIISEENAVPSGRYTASPDTCPVFDLEDHAWKSFRWDSVTTISFVME